MMKRALREDRSQIGLLLRVVAALNQVEARFEMCSQVSRVDGQEKVEGMMKAVKRRAIVETEVPRWPGARGRA